MSKIQKGKPLKALESITNSSIASYFVKKYKNDFVINYDGVKLARLYHWNGNLWSFKTAEPKVMNLLSNEIYMELHEATVRDFSGSRDFVKMLKNLLLLQDRKFRQNTLLDIKDKYKQNYSNQRYQAITPFLRGSTPIKEKISTLWGSFKKTQDSMYDEDGII